MGTPAVNVALIGFNRKNSYNAASPKIDASLKFAISDILPILGVLGVNVDLTQNPLDPTLVALASIAVTKGDILQLDTNVANTGLMGGTNTETGFGKIVGGQVIGGRRLADDTIDIILSAIAGGPFGDNVPLNEDGFVPTDNFPFLHAPHQPLPRSSADPLQVDTNVDDGTRN